MISFAMMVLVVVLLVMRAMSMNPFPKFELGWLALAIWALAAIIGRVPFL